MIAGVALALALVLPPRDSWFGADKIKHFFVAAFTQSVAYNALRLSGARHGVSLAGASAATATISLGKEFYDRRHSSLFSVRDLVWDAAGAGTATFVLERSRR
jgi:putative lipoprotein